MSPLAAHVHLHCNIATNLSLVSILSNGSDCECPLWNCIVCAHDFLPLCAKMVCVCVYVTNISIRSPTHLFFISADLNKVCVFVCVCVSMVADSNSCKLTWIVKRSGLPAENSTMKGNSWLVNSLPWPRGGCTTKPHSMVWWAESSKCVQIAQRLRFLADFFFFFCRLWTFISECSVKYV